MAAEVKGVLIYDESTNCLLMELEDVQYPVVWPAGARWQADPPAVVLDNAEIVEPGMTVYGGGGYIQQEHVELIGPAVAAAADRCTGPSGEIALFNIEFEVEVVADWRRSPILRLSESALSRHVCASSLDQQCMAVIERWIYACSRHHP